MRSKKDKDTVIIVTTDSNEGLAKILSDNRENWDEIKNPELDNVLAELPHLNRAERRRQRFKKGA